MIHIQVAAGIIRNNSDDTVLLGMRPAHTVHGGKWEFPGGKLEADETPLQALKREIFEETGIRVDSAHPLIQIDEIREDTRLTLHAWCVDKWSGQAEGREGQRLEWVKCSALDQKTMPPINTEILRAYSLPPLYLITPDLEEYDDRFLRLTETLLVNGLRLLQFRSRRTALIDHLSMVRELVQLCNQHGCRLVYNGSVDEALLVGAQGVHLRSELLGQIACRPAESGLLVSASCHSLDQLMQANSIKCDFCVVAPVHETASHPGILGMGWNRFRDIVRHARQPVYALGGIRPHELTDARYHGAHGVAMIGGIWNMQDPVEALHTVMLR